MSLPWKPPLRPAWGLELTRASPAHRTSVTAHTVTGKRKLLVWLLCVMSILPHLRGPCPHCPIGKRPGSLLKPCSLDPHVPQAPCLDIPTWPLQVPGGYKLLYFTVPCGFTVVAIQHPGALPNIRYFSLFSVTYSWYILNFFILCSLFYHLSYLFLPSFRLILKKKSFFPYTSFEVTDILFPQISSSVFSNYKVNQHLSPLQNDIKTLEDKLHWPLFRLSTIVVVHLNSTHF